MIAADGEMMQLGLAHTGGMNRHAAGGTNDNDIIAMDFNPRQELMYWIDSERRRIYRSALPKGFNFCSLFSFYHKIQKYAYIK